MFYFSYQFVTYLLSLPHTIMQILKIQKTTKRNLLPWKLVPFYLSLAQKRICACYIRNHKENILLPNQETKSHSYKKHAPTVPCGNYTTWTLANPVLIPWNTSNLRHLNVWSHHATSIKRLKILLSVFEGNKYFPIIFNMFTNKKQIICWASLQRQIWSIRHDLQYYTHIHKEQSKKTMIHPHTHCYSSSLFSEDIYVWNTM
jgi:hypothetical protein